MKLFSHFLQGHRFGARGFPTLVAVQIYGVPTDLHPCSMVPGAF